MEKIDMARAEKRMRQAGWAGIIFGVFIFGFLSLFIWEGLVWFALGSLVSGIIELTVIIPWYYPKGRVNPPDPRPDLLD